MAKTMPQRETAEMPRLSTVDLRSARVDALPNVFQTEIRTSVMQPHLVPGTRAVFRRASHVDVGEVACLRHRGGIFWRRAAAQTVDGPLWRADLSPLPAVAGGEVLGVLVTPASPLVARQAPELWSQLCWHAGMAKSVADLVSSRLRRRRESRIPGVDDSATTEGLATGFFIPRFFTASDLPVWQSFERSHGHAPLDERHLGRWLGLFLPSGQLIGRTGLELRSADAFHHSLFVAPAWRGQGAGRALLDASIREAVRANVGVVRCTIHPRNLRSERLHAACGFRCGAWASPDDLASAEYPVRTWHLPGSEGKS